MVGGVALKNERLADYVGIERTNDGVGAGWNFEAAGKAPRPNPVGKENPAGVARCRLAAESAGSGVGVGMCVRRLAPQNVCKKKKKKKNGVYRIGCLSPPRNRSL